MNLLKSKTVAIVVLLVIMVGALYASSANSIVVSPGEPVSLISFVSSFFRPVVALCDPVPGGSGPGGDN